MINPEILQPIDAVIAACPDADLPKSVSARWHTTVPYGTESATVGFYQRPGLSIIHVTSGPDDQTELHLDMYEREESEFDGFSQSASVGIIHAPKPIDDDVAVTRVNPSLDIIGSKLAASTETAVSTLGGIVRRYADIVPVSFEVVSPDEVMQLFDPKLPLNTELKNTVVTRCQNPTSMTTVFPNVWGRGTDEDGNFIVQIYHTNTEHNSGTHSREVILNVECPSGRLGFEYDEKTDTLEFSEMLRKQPGYPQIIDPTIPVEGDEPLIANVISRDPTAPILSGNFIQARQRMTAYLQKLSAVSTTYEGLFETDQ